MVLLYQKIYKLVRSFMPIIFLSLIINNFKNTIKKSLVIKNIYLIYYIFRLVK